jgi:hypothetical protein
MAVVATLSKGCDLNYIWKQVDRGPAKDAASYYIQASESGGEPPGRWWGPGANALALKDGQRVERKGHIEGLQLGSHNGFPSWAASISEESDMNSDLEKFGWWS